MRHGYNPGAGSMCHSPFLGPEKDTADAYLTCIGGHKALRDLFCIVALQTFVFFLQSSLLSGRNTELNTMMW